MEKKKLEFSKLLLLQESVLIWIMSIGFLGLAFYCVALGFTGSLPWLAAMVGCPWTAYAVSQAFYYKKALKENTVGGLKFETTMAAMSKTVEQSEYDIDYNYTSPNDVDEYRI